MNRIAAKPALDVKRAIWFYAFMRTTVELPPELMRQAKALAASRGESLKTLLTRAVSFELGQSQRQAGSHGRVRLPLFGDPRGELVNISGADIARALAEDDATARGSRRSRKK